MTPVCYFLNKCVNKMQSLRLTFTKILDVAEVRSSLVLGFIKKSKSCLMKEVSDPGLTPLWSGCWCDGGHGASVPPAPRLLPARLRWHLCAVIRAGRRRSRSPRRRLKPEHLSLIESAAGLLIWHSSTCTAAPRGDSAIRRGLRRHPSCQDEVSVIQLQQPVPPLARAGIAY